MFHLFFYVCCKCVYVDVAYVFTHMMQVFYLDVAYVYNGFKCFQVFLQVFQKHSLSVPSVFRSMLQSVVSNIDVSKVDRVLHMLQCDPSAAAAGGGVRVRVRRRHHVGSSRVRTPCRVRWSADAMWGWKVSEV